MIELAHEHPWMTFWLIIIIIYMALYFVINCIMRCWCFALRHLNIRSKGWPPPHCDADGDFKKDPKEIE